MTMPDGFPLPTNNEYDDESESEREVDDNPEVCPSHESPEDDD